MLQNFWIGTDFATLLSSLPGANASVKSMMESQIKNIRALEEANQHAIEAFHAVFNRQNEILHSALAETAKAMSSVSGEASDSAFARQMEIARTATEHTLENLRQMSDRIASASEKASRVLNARVSENMEELKAITGRK